MNFLRVILYPLIPVYAFDLIPFEKTELMNLLISVVLLILLGIVSIMFGVSILRLKKKFGPLATATGAVNIITGASFVTIIFFFIALLLLIPTAVLEVVLMFKAAKKF